ncbi:MAG: alpha/beta hydrolase [Planctomycetota bacterium]
MAGPTAKQLAPGVWWQPVGKSDAQVARIVVCVHGTGGNGRDELGACIPFADSAFRHRGDSGILLAPTYDVPYQFLEPNLPSALIAWIDRVAEPYRVHRKIGLWGFLGGAQFVYRFALQHPDRVDRVAAFAAGEWTVPDGTHDGLMSRTAWFERPSFDAYPTLRPRRDPRPKGGSRSVGWWAAARRNCRNASNRHAGLRSVCIKQIPAATSVNSTTPATTAGPNTQRSKPLGRFSPNPIHP